MPGPARAGAVVFAQDLERLADFYCQLLGMQRLHADATHQVIESADLQLVLHAIPPDIAAGLAIATPPVPRTDTALKLFFSVDSLDAARRTARALGGDVASTGWAGPGFSACDGWDPEGNVFQLREFAR